MFYYPRSSLQAYKCNFPIDPKFFKEELFSDLLQISPQYPSIDYLIDLVLSPKIENFFLRDGIYGTSYEGIHLSESQLSVTCSLNSRITYSSKNQTHGVTFNSLKNISIMLPSSINDSLAVDLLRKKRIILTPYIECISGRVLDERSFQQNALIFFNASPV